MSSILKIRDKDGKFIGVNAIKGADGKSAYEQAVDGGFVGTESEFIEAMTKNAGHGSYEISQDLNIDIMSGNNKIKISAYNSETLNTPYTEKQTEFSHGMVITNAHSSQYATQLCLPSGDSHIYLRVLDNGKIRYWAPVPNNSDFKELEGSVDQHSIDLNYMWEELDLCYRLMSRIETGAYFGTGNSGVDNKNRLTFADKPKMVVFSEGVIFIYGDDTTWSKTTRIGIDKIYWVLGHDLTTLWNENGVEWYIDDFNNALTDTEKAALQLNSSKTYHYVAVF